jgi:hypothetical protein
MKPLFDQFANRRRIVVHGHAHSSCKTASGVAAVRDVDITIRCHFRYGRQGGRGGKLTFPFFTIENVDVVDADHIIVGNDNKLAFSSGRPLGRSDDNELTFLKVTDLLHAK